MKLRERESWIEETAPLLDLCFLEDYVLAHDRIIFAQLQLARGGPRVFLRDVEVSGIGAAHQSDQDGILLGLRHDASFCFDLRPTTPRSSSGLWRFGYHTVAIGSVKLRAVKEQGRF
jgi:hypothetical protein